MEARQRMIDAVMGQFGRPRGLAGILAGWEMTVRPSNRKRNLWAVDLLEVRPADRVLEIGFGPGVAIRALARRASAGFVYGIDHSEVYGPQPRGRWSGTGSSSVSDPRRTFPPSASCSTRSWS
jgi:SAM-dependent methyltransferase